MDIAHRDWAFELNFTWLGDASAQCPSHRYFLISTWHHVHYRGFSPEHDSGIFWGPRLKSLELRFEAAKRRFCLFAQGLELFLELEPVKLCLQIDIHEKAWSPYSLHLESLLLLARRKEGEEGHSSSQECLQTAHRIRGQGDERVHILSALEFVQLPSSFSTAAERERHFLVLIRP